jgi:hypothetical protein
MARENEAVLARVASGLAAAVHALIAGCTAGVVVVGIGSEWRMLAQRGPEDLSRSWRRLVARTVRADGPRLRTEGAIVAPVSSTKIRSMLIAVPVEGIALPANAGEIVQPLLDAGGILFDAALSTPLPKAAG